jgi:hypothetical protein
MGRRIPFTVEIGVVGRNDFVQPHEDVLSHMGIGVFIDGDPCRRMRNIDDAEATSHPRLFNSLFYLPGNVNQLALLRSRYTEAVNQFDPSLQVIKHRIDPTTGHKTFQHNMDTQFVKRLRVIQS